MSFNLKLILTISHGLAAAERGFSVNKDIIKSNVSLETVIPKRIIYHHMRSNQLRAHAADINNVMILAFKSASSKHKFTAKTTKNKMKKLKLRRRPFI